MTLNVNALPALAPFPATAWRNHLVPTEWEACLDAWISISGAHLSLSPTDFLRISVKDDSVPLFLTSYAAETAVPHMEPLLVNKSKTYSLRKQCYLLSHRLLEVDTTPESLLHWEFLANLTKIYGRRQSSKIMELAWKNHTASLETSLSIVKASLIKDLEAGLNGDLKRAESYLKRLNHLLHASPEAAAFYMAGSDFLDALITCYKVMNPPLRKAIVSTTYLCLIGLTEGKKPNFSALVDQLYSLQAAAEAHKAGPTNANDSLVVELVTMTPVLKQVQQRIESGGSGSNRAQSVLAALEKFKNAGSIQRPPKLKRMNSKGKGVAKGGDSFADGSDVHVHRMSLITQVQDIFPELGSGFIVKLLDVYNDSAEEVISHLLEDALPSSLQNANRSEELKPSSQSPADLAPKLASHSTPPRLSIRRNIFDDDEFDQLAIDASRLHFGRRNPDKTTEDILSDKSTAPAKAAIFSALAAFDSDDDERDDTYDVEDVGGTVDSATPGNNPEEVNVEAKDSGIDEVLFKTYKATPGVFGRDAATRRGTERLKLRQETGMTDEAIEGWALMLSRDTARMKRLDTDFSGISREQNVLASTAWKASPAGSGTEESDVDGTNRGRGGYRGRGGRGRGRGRGNVAGPTGEKGTEVARQKKEAHKSSRANHNRRDQRAKKMARGGFPG